MSYRKAANLDKNILLRETFNSEQETRRNGGVPTDVVFDKGSIVNTIGFVDYTPLTLSSTWSIRLKFNISDASTINALFGNLYSAGYYTRLYIATNGSINLYNEANIAAGAGTGSIVEDVDNELVITNNGLGSENIQFYLNGIDLDEARTLAGGFKFRQLVGIGNGTYPLLGSISLFEIYNKALTQEEVTNLYNDARYKVPNLEHSAQGDGVDLNVSACENSANDTFTNVSSSGFTTTKISGSSRCGTADEIVYVTDARFIVTLDLVLNSGELPNIDFVNSFVGTSKTYEGPQILVSGNNSLVLTANASSTGLLVFKTSTATNYSVSNLSVQNLAVEPTSKILHVTAREGVVRNLCSGDVNNNSPMDIGMGSFEDGTVEEWKAWSANQISNDNNVLKVVYVDNDNGAYNYLRESYDLNRDLTIGNRYILKVRSKVESSGATEIQHYDGLSWMSSGQLTEEYKWYEFDFIAASEASCRFQLNGMVARDIAWIDHWYLEEIIPEVVNTDIEVVKDSPGYVPRFNGSTSKVDCGSYNDLTGDITVLAWVNPKTIGEANAGNILTNGQLIIWFTTIGRFALRSDNAVPTATSDVNVWLSNEWNLMVAVRKANGDTSWYINGELSAAADQVTDIPVAGTTNIIVGNANAGTNAVDGKLPETIVLSGLLTSTEISAYHSSTKHLYGQ